MASLIYNSCLDDTVRGIVDFDTDTFKVMALGAAYTENKDTHLKRSDLTNEVSGTGYTAGGNSVTVTVTKDLANDRIDISLGGTTWPTSTISGAQKFAYYKSRGGVATADELVAVIDNGTAVSTTAGTLTLTASTLRISNP
jgi:hypothetical protein